MILNDDAREAFRNEDWDVVKKYVEHLEAKEVRLGKLEEKLNLMEKDGHTEVLNCYFSEFKA